MNTTKRELIGNVGLNAYQLAVRGGFVGSQTAWLATLATLLDELDDIVVSTLAQINIDIPQIRDDILLSAQNAINAEQAALIAAAAAEAAADRVDLGALDAAVAEATAQAAISIANADIAVSASEQTAADSIKTAADSIQTGLDRIQTGLDRIQTGEDTITTAADRVVTNADRVQTGLDRIVTIDNAIRSTAQQELSTSSANRSAERALNAATQLSLANEARLGAEVARDASQLSSGVYPDTITGLQATLAGTYFSVPSENNNEYLILYRHVILSEISTAVEIQRYPSVAGIEYQIANVLYIKQNGNDSYDGRSSKSALRTIERALELATESATPTLIEWYPEAIVYTNGHLDMPDNCVIKAAHRTVFLRPNPGFEERNVFRMGSGCFLEGVMFEGWRLDSLDNPTEGFAVSFRPGAVIMRVPYAHKIAVRSIPYWGQVAPPLDRKNGNPEVGRGGGVILADGLVCSQYSIFPNIMAWGATPVIPNGVGYCAKNGGLVNAVNAVCIWAHKHFMALSGGQIILSACSTQFGDFSMESKGFRNLVIANEVQNLTVQLSADNAISDASTDLVNMAWGALVFDGYAVELPQSTQDITRRSLSTFIQCIRWTLKTANQQPMLDFAKGLYNVLGVLDTSTSSLEALIYSFNYLRVSIKALPGVNNEADIIVDNLVNALINTIETPVFRKDPSRITAIGHTWSAVMAGVALTKIPPARNGSSIADSIIEADEGLVIASGQDDQGNALFVGGLAINADTGELGGPPFDQAVRRVATRAAISRSF